MTPERDVWAHVQEFLHPASGSEAMLVTLTLVHDEYNLTSGGCRVGKVATISASANDSPGQTQGSQND